MCQCSHVSMLARVPVYTHTLQALFSFSFLTFTHTHFRAFTKHTLLKHKEWKKTHLSEKNNNNNKNISVEKSLFFCVCSALKGPDVTVLWDKLIVCWTRTVVCLLRSASKLNSRQSGLHLQILQLVDKLLQSYLGSFTNSRLTLIPSTVCDLSFRKQNYMCGYACTKCNNLSVFII